MVEIGSIWWWGQIPWPFCTRLYGLHIDKPTWFYIGRKTRGTPINSVKGNTILRYRMVVVVVVVIVIVFEVRTMGLGCSVQICIIVIVFFRFTAIITNTGFTMNNHFTRGRWITFAVVVIVLSITHCIGIGNIRKLKSQRVIFSDNVSVISLYWIIFLQASE